MNKLANPPATAPVAMASSPSRMFIIISASMARGRSSTNESPSDPFPSLVQACEELGTSPTAVRKATTKPPSRRAPWRLVRRPMSMPDVAPTRTSPPLTPLTNIDTQPARTVPPPPGR